MIFILFAVAAGILAVLFLIAFACDMECSIQSSKPKIKGEKPILKGDYAPEECSHQYVGRRVTLLPSGIVGKPYKLRTYKLVLRTKYTGEKKRVEYDGIDAVTVCREYNRLFNADRNFEITDITEITK